MTVQMTLPGIEVKPGFTTVAGIRAWAKSIYEQGGHWIMECWSDDDLVQFMHHRENGREVRRDLYRYIKSMEEQSKEVLAEVF